MRSTETGRFPITELPALWADFDAALSGTGMTDAKAAVYAASLWVGRRQQLLTALQAGSFEMDGGSVKSTIQGSEVVLVLVK